MKSIKTKVAAAILTSLIASSPSFSQPNDDFSAVADSAKQAGVTVSKIEKTPIAGLVEVSSTDGQIVYFSVDGKYIFGGSIFDTKTKRNLTAEKMATLPSFSWKSLPLSDAVVEKRGNGSREMVIFTDPNCGYCRKLEKEISEISNVKIYRFVVGILGPESVSAADGIWCSKDRSAAYLNYMLKNEKPSAGS